jgi:hypothetical protein
MSRLSTKQRRAGRRRRARYGIVAARIPGTLVTLRLRDRFTATQQAQLQAWLDEVANKMATKLLQHLFGVKLEPWQERLLELVQEKRVVAAKNVGSGRETAFFIAPERT